MRTLLTAYALTNGFTFDGPVEESALTPPDDSYPPTHTFEGRLELLGEPEGGQMEVLRGELEPEYASLPEFDFAFVQDNGYLVPVNAATSSPTIPAGTSSSNRGAPGRKPAMGIFRAPRCPLR